MEANKQEELALARKGVLERIALFEKERRFNEDVEIDNPGVPVGPNDVDYTNEKLSSRFMTRVANIMGRMFFESMIKKQKFIIKDVKGLANAVEVQGGAIVTSNHFNIRDNYAIYRCLKPIFKERQYLYKVIKETNYTRFKGPVRILMRHANTLPLSSNYDTMKKFYTAVEYLLNQGEKILIYPEQAMWWNYRKPRPLKDGAFQIAVKFNKPIMPVFIAMKDSKILDDDGFPVQEYYVNFLPPIYPDLKLNKSENIAFMKEKNYSLWVDTYEKFYNKKLEY